MYKDLWGMEEVASTDKTWLGADKDKLIETLGKTTAEFKVEKKAQDAAAAAKSRSDTAVKLEIKKVNKKRWFKTWLNGDKTPKFYIARQGDQSNLGKMIKKLGTINSQYVAKYNKLPVDKVGTENGKNIYLFEYGKQTYKFLSAKEFIDNLYLTENYGTPLKIKRVTRGPTAVQLREQMVEALGVINAAGIEHQDVTLENMVWDEVREIVTLIDFSDARIKGRPCEANFSGETINILPPKGVDVDKDKWSLVLALLNYGDKTMYRPEDTKTPYESALTTILFGANSVDRTVPEECWKLKGANDQPGFMFHDDGTNLTFRTSKILEKITETGKKELFYHIWFIFNKQDDLDKKILLRGLIPGFSSIGAAMIAGEAPLGKDQHLYVEDIVDQMGDTNLVLAQKWVQGHLRWGKIQEVINDSPLIKENMLDLVTLDKIKDTNTKKNQFQSVQIKDLGKEYYGIPTEEVVKIFEIIKEVAAATGVSSGPSELAYDSFSDAELDELEITYEPYDEEELDRLMSEYESEAESEQSLAYNSESERGSVAYNSESERGSVAYNSESEQSLAYNSESEQSLASYNSESEKSLAYNSESERGSVAYNSESERGSVAYNSESESEKVEYTAGYDSDSD
jgi:serine/threonine protein kinase